MPVTAPPSPSGQHGRPGQRGFTLLEVMCAFAILSVVTAQMTQIISQNMDKAATAIDQRELRELADTVFGKILFEQTEHRNGDSGSMGNDYARWSGITDQARIERYEVYLWRLEKVEMVAAGVTDDPDQERLFESDEDQDTGRDTGTRVPATPGAEEGEGVAASVTLVRFTLRVYHRDRPQEELMTLTRYLKPPNIPGLTVR
jgi:prepilin-type N-terminal cleavage/methylation domain-containing protein